VVRWYKDNTGRFPQRPHYDPEEIDAECEALVQSFLRRKYGKIEYPVSTNDIVILLEQEAESLDVWAELNDDGSENVEGVTTFSPKSRPAVQVSRHLSESEYRENRYRTTLTHELGHVKLHAFLWSFEQIPLAKSSTKVEARCLRESIIVAAQTDWMEWQAGYASGAYLMPASALRDAVRSFRDEHALSIANIRASTPLGEELIRAIQRQFQVSADAARVRLSKTRYLSESEAPSLFDTR